MKTNHFKYFSFIVMMILVLSAQAQIITEVSSLEFYEQHMHILEEESTVLIDGRSKEMYEEGHIKGAIFIDAFQDGFLPELSSFAGKSVIVVYCTTRRRTNVLINALKEFYTGHVYCICDGITGWKNNILPLVQSE